MTREPTTHIDGTRVFHNATDERNENEVAALCGHVWDCELRRFAALSPIDWYAVRAERVIGVVELKSRTVTTTTYPTVFLAARKWLALHLAAAGLDVPAIFAARFTDGTRYIRLDHLAPRRVRVGGATRNPEPVIEVPVADMARLERDET